MALGKLSEPFRLARLWLLLPLAAGWACTHGALPELEDPTALSPARMEVRSGQLHVSSANPEAPALLEVEARSFRDWSELVAFAAEELGAEPVYGEGGEVVAIRGEIVQSGEVLLRDADGSVFADDELVPAFLGGATGRLRVGEEDLDLQLVDPERSVALFAQSDETCAGTDCVSGESWVTHRVFYHSVGGRTRQTSGGTRTVSYRCCRSGRLVTVDGRPQCRLLRPGAWEYDRELGRLVPTSPDPYLFTDPQTCSRETLANRLNLELRLIFGPNQFATLTAPEGVNTPQVQIKRWLVSVGVDLGAEFVDDVVGVCGFHSSNRGGFVQTSDGFTGDDGLLCDRG